MNICYDDSLYQNLLLLKKALLILQIGVPILIVFIVFILYLFRGKKRKIQVYKYAKRLSILGILIVILSTIGLIIVDYSNKLSNYNDCLEEEELMYLDKQITLFEPKIVSAPLKTEKELELEESNEFLASDENIADEEIIIRKDEEEEETEKKDELTKEKNFNDKVSKDTKEEKNELSKDNYIYFLNVGASTESFIIEDNGHFGLIDTSYNNKANFILKQLAELGAEKLDFIIITHAHMDHMGGFSKIIRNIPVDTLYIKNPKNLNSSYLMTYHQMVRQAEIRGIAICDVSDEICQSFRLENFNIKLYNIDYINSKDIDGYNRSRIENANSLCTLIEINNRKIYLASDIGNYFGHNTESDISKEVGDVDIYKASHHGYVTFNNNQDVIYNLKPEYAIITNPKEQSDTINRRLRFANDDYKKTYYTPEGTIILHVDSDGTMDFKQ